MKTPQKKSIKVLSIAALAVVTMLSQVLMPMTASAAQITVRKLTLQDGATVGGSTPGGTPGGTVNHFFEFTVPSTATAIGSIKFEYCTLAAGACVTPTGLDTTAATLGSEGANATGFSAVVTTNGAPYLTRTAAAPSGGSLSYQLQTITNPTTANQTFFVRISTYTSTNTSGGATDTGTVAASTATPIELTGTMPESLVFCTGGTITTTGGVPDCATATSGAVSFNQLFSPTDTATATSQMAASTNAGAGYNITVTGPTLTSGANTITAMGTAAAGIRGTSQFGINLKANTVSTATPAIGSEATPVANGTNYKGQAASNYDTIDNFKFASGDSVARSDNGGAGGSDAQILTASYIVNVPGSQPAGTYTTTLTYICTPTF